MELYTLVPERTVIPSDLNRARQLEESLIQRLSEAGYGESDVFAIKLALEEALVNAIKHGNQYDPDKSVTVTTEITHEQAKFTITDQGSGFTPEDVPDPTADENLMQPCGRGLMLIRSFMDEAEFNETGNELRLLKRRGSGCACDQDD